MYKRQTIKEIYDMVRSIKFTKDILIRNYDGKGASTSQSKRHTVRHKKMYACTMRPTIKHRPPHNTPSQLYRAQRDLHLVQESLLS